MSAHPSSDSAESHPVDNPSTAPAVAGDARPDSNETIAPESQSARAGGRKILIGSQRDVADPALRAGKTLHHGDLNPSRTKDVIKPNRLEPATPPDPASAPQPASASQPGPASEMLLPASSSPAAVPTAAPAPPVISRPLPGEPAPAPSPVAVTESSLVPGMDDELEAALDDLQMESLLGSSLSGEEIELESRIKGVVSRIHHDNVFFTLKGQYEGIASLRQFKTPPGEVRMLEVVVSGFREDEGLYEVNIPGAAVSVADWSDLNEGAVVDVRITGSNTGGLECNINNIRGFIPASQIDVAHVENFGDYVNQKMQCVVTEVNPQRKRLVLSRRAVLEREAQARKQELLETLEVGQTLDGVVTRLMDFGAFVDIGGAEGLVHVSKLSWDRVTHPKDVLEPGQKITVKVEKIAADTGKIGLSLRDTQENPWQRVDQKYPPGAVVEGVVTRLAQFGAFVKLEPGIEGLIHISELAHHRVIAVKNVVSRGDTVQVKVLTVDPAAQKIGLSLKATQTQPEKSQQKQDDAMAEPTREMAVKRRDEPLQGGRGRTSGGEQFGLNW